MKTTSTAAMINTDSVDDLRSATPHIIANKLIQSHHVSHAIAKERANKNRKSVIAILERILNAKHNTK